MEETTYLVTNFSDPGCQRGDLQQCRIDPDFTPRTTRYRPDPDSGFGGLEFSEDFGLLTRIVGSPPLEPTPESGERERLTRIGVNLENSRIPYTLGPGGPPLVDPIEDATDSQQYPASLGDFDLNGEFTADDINGLSLAVAAGGGDAEIYDLNGDRVVTSDDRVFWVERLAKTYFGDSNLDGLFDTAEMVEVFRAGEYEGELPANSQWQTGDWTGDREFGTEDLVLAFQHGGYERGPRRLQPVPEPTGVWWLLLMLAAVPGHRRRSAEG